MTKKSTPSNVIRLPSPEMAAAVSMRHMLDRQSTDPDPDPEEIARDLEEQGKAVAGGDATIIRRALAAQVTTLERLFHHFMQLAAEEKPGSDAHDRLFRLALRAQSQSARTGTMLARLCHLMPAAEKKTEEKPEDYDPFQDTPLGKKLAMHTDPDINYYTKRPRVQIQPGTSLHDLFECATSSVYFAQGVEELLNSTVPWPAGVSAADYARAKSAQRKAAAEAAAAAA